MRPIKQAAARLYPPGHALREAVLREPDTMTEAEAEPVLEVYLRMAFMLRTGTQG